MKARSGGALLVRLHVLSLLQRDGRQHGYALLEAVRRTSPNTVSAEPSAGSVYRTLAAVVDEGLAIVADIEREGARPERRLVEITDAGCVEVDRLRREMLLDARLGAQAVDIALTCTSPDSFDRLHGDLLARRDALEAELGAAAPETGLRPEGDAAHRAARLVSQHRTALLRTEVGFIEEILQLLPAPPAPER